MGFIERATEVHGGRYDYSRVEYINNRTKVIIICPAHGEFEQIPNNHTSGAGCKECAKLKREQTNLERYGHINVAHGKEAKEKIKRTNLERYGVDEVFGNIDIRHKSNQTRLERYGHINPAHGKDAKEKIKRTNLERYGVGNVFEKGEIRDGIKRTNLERYGVSNIGESELIKRRIRENTLSKYGIHYSQRHMTDIIGYIRDYNWLYNEYIIGGKTVQAIASELGITTKTMSKYLTDSEFKIREIVGYSYRCIQWLEYIMENEGINIQHALNGGEYRIPNTKYRVDGFCVNTNTIYEFHGDRWHGNPKIFKADEKCNHWSNLTANELYQKTMNREKTLIKLGYNLISVWESDWISRG